jgi:ribonuclease BN (tRNA processing enzyme)
MRLTIIGSGDAFGSGGRSHTCFHVKTSKSTLLVDCGASALVSLKRLAVDPNSIDGIILSHLHGDHFGGLPFLLLDAQFAHKRERPLVIAGPPGTRQRLQAAVEALFPRAASSTWRFAWEVQEIALETPTNVCGHDVWTTEVVHFSGAPSTALRIADGQRLLAYSGDTEWTEALIKVADRADLYITECYGYASEVSGHLSWQTLKSRLRDLKAQRIMVTHMSPSMLAHLDEPRAAGLLVAEDGDVLEF